MINLLIVEDSRVVSEYLYYIFSKDPQIQVIGNVSNGKLAIEFIKEHKPDVITMDIEMPVMDGLEATRIIMSTTPVPILIVTGSKNAKEIPTSIEALASGALAVIEKPLGVSHPKSEMLAKKLVSMVKLMSEVSVVTRKIKSFPPKNPLPVDLSGKLTLKTDILHEIIAIGVSSGGPTTLKTVFSKISCAFPVPIVVVQHIASGFLTGLVHWLQKTLDIPVRIAEDGEKLLPGRIYFAPDSYQMTINSKGCVKLEKSEINGGFCPSVDYLFKGIASAFGNKAIGILLTGMGSDGAKELKTMRDRGAFTIAQSKESSLIFGMPGVAVQLGAAEHILSAEEIAAILYEMEMKDGKGKC